METRICARRRKPPPSLRRTRTLANHPPNTRVRGGGESLRLHCGSSIVGPTRTFAVTCAEAKASAFIAAGPPDDPPRPLRPAWCAEAKASAFIAAKGGRTMLTSFRYAGARRRKPPPSLRPHPPYPAADSAQTWCAEAKASAFTAGTRQTSGGVARGNHTCAEAKASAFIAALSFPCEDNCQPSARRRKPPPSLRLLMR